VEVIATANSTTVNVVSATLTGGSDTDLFIYLDDDLCRNRYHYRLWWGSAGSSLVAVRLPPAVLVHFEVCAAATSRFRHDRKRQCQWYSVGGSSLTEVTKLQGKTRLDVEQPLADGNYLIV
jgi:hypothetical protein